MTQETKSPAEQMDVREALAAEIEGAIHVTITKRDEKGRVISETIMVPHRNLIVTGLRALPPSNPPGGWQAICDSYAEENQRLSDQLEAANAKLANPPGAERGNQLVDFAELKLLIDEYNPLNSDWNFRKGVLLDILVRLWPRANPPGDMREKVIEECAQHFSQRKFGKDRYLFPDEIADEIRSLASPKDAAATAVGAQNGGTAA